MVDFLVVEEGLGEGAAVVGEGALVVLEGGGLGVPFEESMFFLIQSTNLVTLAYTPGILGSAQPDPQLTTP